MCPPKTVWARLQVSWLAACCLGSSMVKGNKVPRLAKALAMTLLAGEPSRRHHQ